MVTKVKSPAIVERETRAKIAQIREKLAQIRDYKKILEEDGLEPDRADKELESELIVKLLRLEKSLGLNTKKTRSKPKTKGAKARPAAKVARAKPAKAAGRGKTPRHARAKHS